MSAIEDLEFIGAPVSDPVATASFIGGMILTRRQKAALLKDYLTQKGAALTDAVRRAADVYADVL